MERESAGAKCPSCGYRFRTLADEVGMHECPRCGYYPDMDRDDHDDWDGEAPSEGDDDGDDE